jgi:thiosulfate reductase cytochrome b subunit|tara:strand:+ start:1095 stop:1382 length:288 start_codon:yes stop_codon:yes gene_type:complete
MSLIENLVWWQCLAAFWVSTWYLTLIRTWRFIVQIIKEKQPDNPMANYTVLHFILYAVLINFLLPVVGLPLALSDDYRKRWVYGYTESIMKRNDD